MAHFSELHDPSHIFLQHEQHKEGNSQNGNHELHDDQMYEEWSTNMITKECVFHKGLHESRPYPIDNLSTAHR